MSTKAVISLDGQPIFMKKSLILTNSFSESQTKILRVFCQIEFKFSFQILYSKTFGKYLELLAQTVVKVNVIASIPA